jgi:cytoskeletal protein CcmA (bactofilin family)
LGGYTAGRVVAREGKLFWNKVKSEARPNRIDSLIGTDTVVEGDVNFAGGLRVEGEVKGNVSVAHAGAGVLMLGENAIVNGNVHVTHLVVYGSITGSVYVTDLVELRPTAVIVGDVHYGTLEMQMGAVIDGHLVHVEVESRPTS